MTYSSLLCCEVEAEYPASSKTCFLRWICVNRGADPARNLETAGPGPDDLAKIVMCPMSEHTYLLPAASLRACSFMLDGLAG